MAGAPPGSSVGVGGSGVVGGLGGQVRGWLEGHVPGVRSENARWGCFWAGPGGWGGRVRWRGAGTAGAAVLTGLRGRATPSAVMAVDDPVPPPQRPVEPDRAWSYARTLKDPLVEELVDLYWHRPLAYALLRPWEHARWRPTPNQFTLGGGALGVLAAVVALAAPQCSPLWLLAAFLMFFANLLDCCDGMLARLTGQSSSRGMLLDGMIDFIVGVSFWLAMSIRTAPPNWGWWGVPAALSIVLSILIHTGLYDHMRIRFGVLANPPPTPRVVAEPPQPANTPYPVHRGLSTRFVEWFFRFAQAFYEVTYTNISRICIGVEPSSPRPDIDPAVARQILAGPMRMATHLGLGTHLVLMYGATALAVFDLHLPFYIALGTVVVGLNVWSVFTVLAWRRAEAVIANVARGEPQS